MFFVLAHENYCGKNPIKQLFFRLFPVKKSIERIDSGLCRYGVITVRTAGGKVNAERINRMLCGYSQRLLIPDTLKGRGINGFCSDEYLKGVLFNTAAYFLSRSEGDRRNLTVAVIDRTGEFSRRAQQLFKYAGSVQIYTEQPQRYRILSEDTVARFGADFVLREQSRSTADLPFVISPCEIPPCLYISNERYELDEQVFKAAPGFSRLLPKGISEADFAAALAVYEKHSRFFSIKSEMLRKNGSAVSVGSTV